MPGYHTSRLLCASLVIAWGLMAPVPLSAQATWPDSGARVRIDAPRVNLRNATGTFVNAERDSVRVLFPGAWGIRAAHVADVRRLDVSLGEGYGANVVSGGMIGAVAGLLVGFVGSNLGGGDEGSVGFNGMVFAGAVGAGALIGAVIGAMIPGERWQRIPLPR